jgi:hypothetical protein
MPTADGPIPPSRHTGRGFCTPLYSRKEPRDEFYFVDYSGWHPGLAAAAVSEPTVAYCTRYFSHLQTGAFTKGVGPYGYALRRPVIDVYDNFPEKSASMGENRIFQIPPDFVVNSQAVDIIELLLEHMSRPHGVHLAFFKSV